MEDGGRRVEAERLGRVQDQLTLERYAVLLRPPVPVVRQVVDVAQQSLQNEEPNQFHVADSSDTSNQHGPRKAASAPHGKELSGQGVNRKGRSFFTHVWGWSKKHISDVVIGAARPTEVAQLHDHTTAVEQVNLQQELWCESKMGTPFSSGVCLTGLRVRLSLEQEKS